MKSLESKEFTCGGLYFERLTNWMSKRMRRTYSVSNIEISLLKSSCVLHWFLKKKGIKELVLLNIALV